MKVAWKTTLFTVADWLAVPHGRHQLFLSFDFATHHNVEADELHVKYLGTDAVLFGTVLFIIVDKLLHNGSLANNMAELWERLSSAYRTLGTKPQFSSLNRLSQIVKDVGKPRAHYPRLKGKGAEIKNVCGALLRVFSDVKRVGDENDAMVEQILINNLKAQDMIDLHGDDFF